MSSTRSRKEKTSAKTKLPNPFSLLSDAKQQLSNQVANLQSGLQTLKDGVSSAVQTGQQFVTNVKNGDFQAAAGNVRDGMSGAINVLDSAIKATGLDKPLNAILQAAGLPAGLDDVFGKLRTFAGSFDQLFSQIANIFTNVLGFPICLDEILTDFMTQFKAGSGDCSVVEGSVHSEADFARLDVSGSINTLSGIELSFNGMMGLCHKAQALKQAYTRTLEVVKNLKDVRTAAAMTCASGNLREKYLQVSEKYKNLRNRLRNGKTPAQGQQQQTAAGSAQAQTGAQGQSVTGGAAAAAGQTPRFSYQHPVPISFLQAKARAVVGHRSAMASELQSEEKMPTFQDVVSFFKTVMDLFFRGIDRLFKTMKDNMNKCARKQNLRINLQLSYKFFDARMGDTYSGCVYALGLTDFVGQIIAKVVDLPILKSFPRLSEFIGAFHASVVTPLFSVPTAMFDLLPDVGGNGGCVVKGKEFVGLQSIPMKFQVVVDLQLGGQDLPVLKFGTETVQDLCVITSMLEKFSQVGVRRTTQLVESVAAKSTNNLVKVGAAVAKMLITVVDKLLSVNFYLASAMFGGFVKAAEMCANQNPVPANLAFSIPDIYIPPGQGIAYPSILIRSPFYADLGDSKNMCIFQTCLAAALPIIVADLDKAFGAQSGLGNEQTNNPLATGTVSSSFIEIGRSRRSIRMRRFRADDHQTPFATISHHDVLDYYRFEQTVQQPQQAQQSTTTQVGFPDADTMSKNLQKGLEMAKKFLLGGQALQRLSAVPLCIIKEVQSIIAEVMQKGDCDPLGKGPISEQHLKAGLELELKLGGAMGAHAPNLGRVCSLLMAVKRAVARVKTLFPDLKAIVNTCLKGAMDGTLAPAQPGELRNAVQSLIPGRSGQQAQQNAAQGASQPQASGQRATGSLLQTFMSRSQSRVDNSRAMVQAGVEAELDAAALENVVAAVEKGIEFAGGLIDEFAKGVAQCDDIINPQISFSVEVIYIGKATVPDIRSACALGMGVTSLLKKSQLFQSLLRIPRPNKPSIFDPIMKAVGIAQDLLELPAKMLKYFPKKGSPDGTCTLGGKTYNNLANLEVVMKLIFDVKIGGFPLPKITLATKTANDICLIGAAIEDLVNKYFTKEFLNDMAKRATDVIVQVSQKSAIKLDMAANLIQAGVRKVLEQVDLSPIKAAFSFLLRFIAEVADGLQIGAETCAARREASASQAQTQPQQPAPTGGAPAKPTASSGTSTGQRARFMETVSAREAAWTSPTSAGASSNRGQTAAQSTAGRQSPSTSAGGQTASGGQAPSTPEKQQPSKGLFFEIPPQPGFYTPEVPIIIYGVGITIPSIWIGPMFSIQTGADFSQCAVAMSLRNMLTSFATQMLEKAGVDTSMAQTAVNKMNSALDNSATANRLSGLPSQTSQQSTTAARF